jgi:hypothetical protein
MTSKKNEKISNKAPKFDVVVNFAGAPDTSKMNKLSEEDVDKLLTVIPATKLAQGRAVLLKMDERDEASEKYKQQLALARLTASLEKEERGLGSDKDREAWAMSQDNVIEAKKEELQAILNVKLEEYKYQYLEDLFISARKQANKYEKELDANLQSARYTR